MLWLPHHGAEQPRAGHSNLPVQLQQASLQHGRAEHKSDAYNNDTDAMAYDAASSGRRLASNPRPGFMCPTDTLTDAQMTPYTFQHCTGDVQVGKSYEVHYVHSSAGTDNDASDGMNADLLADGLGGT